MITPACGTHQYAPTHRPHHRAAAIQWLAFTLLLWSPSSQAADRPESSAHASPPLHDQINSLLAREVATTPQEKCDDETFIRRSSLDFRGLTPSASEIQAFLADSRPHKRALLIDTFIADPHHERHLANVLDIMLMERRPEKHVKIAEWRAWLRQKVATHTPWDQLVQQLLSAEGIENPDAPPRGAARWILDREAEPNALTRDTARLFLGMDLACAQCHDHPRIADYWQRDYHGLLAFFTRTFLFQPDPAKPAFVAERAEGEATFTSVFTQVAGQARPSLPQGKPIEEPAVTPASLWSVPPDEKNPSTRPVPTQSRKKSLLHPLTSSRDFALNAANRFWAALLGRGIIDPVDLRHSANPPAADALLDALADGLVTLQYNLSAYWREIALSHAYQASYDPPPTTSAATPNTAENQNAAPSAAAAAAATAAATAAAEAERTARNAENTAREAWEPLQLTAQKLDAEASAATKAVTEAHRLVEAAATAVAQAARDLAAQTALIPVLEAAAQQCAEAAQTVPEAPELTEANTLIQARLATAHQTRETLAGTATTQEADHAAKTAALTVATEKAAALTQQAAAAHTAAQSAWETTANAAESARTTRDIARRLNRDAARATTITAWHNATRQEKTAASRLQTAEITARTLASTTASLETATTSLPNDKELAAVLARLKTRQSAATTAIEISRTEAATASSAATTAAESMVSSLADSFAIARLTPLTPEQLCWSILQATGTLDQLHTQSAREWDEKNPAPATTTETTKPDPTHITTRTQAIHSLTEEKVRPHEEQFVRLFSNGPGSPQTDFFATSDQALYFENAGSVRLWTMPSSGNLAEQLISTTEPATLTSTLWLALLNRPPSQEEIGQATHLITSRPAEEKAAVVSDLMWALLTSAEFRFKH